MQMSCLKWRFVAERGAVNNVSKQSQLPGNPFYHWHISRAANWLCAHIYRYIRRGSRGGGVKRALAPRGPRGHWPPITKSWIRLCIYIEISDYFLSTSVERRPKWLVAGSSWRWNPQQSGWFHSILIQKRIWLRYVMLGWFMGGGGFHGYLYAVQL